jgi:DNA-binding NarL/FixJ family response regulator
MRRRSTPIPSIQHFCHGVRKVTRILIGDFGAIPSLGLQQLFGEVGFDVVVKRSDELIREIAELMPDGVILNLDAEDGRQVAQRVAASFPAATVILCSPDQLVMRVYPRFHHGESYQSHLTPDLLVKAVGS